MKLLPRRIFALLSVSMIMACTLPDQTSKPTGTQSNQMIATALFGEPVFDRDVNDITKAISGASASPIATQKISIRSKGFDYIASNLDDHYSQAVGKMSQSDVLISFFTTHGSQGYIVAGDENGAAPVDATHLNELFSDTNNNPHIVIIQACYSGSLIPELKSPNRIIITAADAEHSSFGCQPDADNTWFAKALKAEIRKGRSWEQIFAATKAHVTAFEKSQGIAPADRSNPQAFVGQNMKAIWNAPI